MTAALMILRAYCMTTACLGSTSNGANGSSKPQLLWRTYRIHALGLMKNLIVHLVLVLALAGCVIDSTVRASAAQLSGTYYSGDGLGRIVTVLLRPDGTFISDWQSCLGMYGQASGTLQLQGDQIFFNPTHEQEMLSSYLRQATTIQYAGQLGFSRAQDVARDRIDEQLVFHKRASEQ